MVQEKSIQKLEKSAVKLTIGVDSASTRKAYDALIAEYSKKAQIKGFRPGKVPASVLESKFGDSLRMEAAQKLVEEAMQEVIPTIDEKPLPYAQPRLEEDFNFVPGENFRFSVSYDVYPVVELKNYKGLSIEEAQVSIGKEDIQRELEEIQDRNAIVSDVKSGKIKKDDMVTATLVELDADGNPVESTRRQDLTFTLGSNATIYDIDEDVTGLAFDANTTISKTYGAEYAHPELASKSIKLQVSISRVRRKDLPAIDDELAQDVDEKYKTLDDLKKDIQARLEKTAADRVRQNKIDALLEQLAAAHSFDLPESMIMSQIYNQYERMVRNFGGNEQTLLQLLAAQGKTVEDLVNDWRPAAEKGLRFQVLVQELVKAEKIEASDTDLDAEYASLASENGQSVEETRKYYVDNQMDDYVRHSVVERKLFDQLFAASTIKKGAKVKYLDLLAKNS